MAKCDSFKSETGNTATQSCPIFELCALLGFETVVLPKSVFLSWVNVIGIQRFIFLGLSKVMGAGVFGATVTTIMQNGPESLAVQV